MTLNGLSIPPATFKVEPYLRLIDCVTYGRLRFELVENIPVALSCFCAIQVIYSRLLGSIPVQAN